MRYLLFLFLLVVAGCTTKHDRCDCTLYVLDAKYTFDNYERCQICSDLFNSDLHTNLREKFLKNQPIYPAVF